MRQCLSLLIVALRGVLLAVPLIASAQAPAAVPPASIPATQPAEGSRERLRRLDVVLQRYVDEGEIAGVVALVLKDGRPVYERAVGWSDKEAGRRMQVDTIFRIASQTKALTSTAILVLVEAGRISFNDPVSRFIPAFARTTVAVADGEGLRSVPAKRPITIHDLLTHTAGISYGTSPEIASLYAKQGLGPYAGYGWYTADKQEPICSTVEKLATLPFAAQPGDAFVYGYNTDILGCVVEQASGVRLDEFIRARITGPLGMKDTQFFLPATKRPRLAAVYASAAEGKAVRAVDGAKGQGDYIDGPGRSFSGGAGLLSTARDYARFLEMIRNDGVLDGQRILAPRSVALMRTNQSGTLHSSSGLGFGYGFETVERDGANGLDAPGAFGWGGAYGTLYRVDPQSGITMVLMMQLLPNQTDIQTRFPAMVYQAFLMPADLASRSATQ